MFFVGKIFCGFIDNEAAAAAIIRGSSSSADVDAIVQISAILALRLESRIWVSGSILIPILLMGYPVMAWPMLGLWIRDGISP